MNTKKKLPFIIFFNIQNIFSIILAFCTFITLLWGIVHSCFQTNFILSIFHFTRQSLFLIMFVVILSFTKYKHTKIYSILSFIALVDILIVGFVFCNFVEDNNQNLVSANWKVQLTPFYLQYFLIPLLYIFYVWHQKITFATFKQMWVGLLHPLLYFVFFTFIFSFSNDEWKSHFIDPYYQENSFLAYFKIILVFMITIISLILIQRSKMHFLLKTLCFLLVCFVIATVPKETSDWNHAKALVLHPQQMGSSLFPEPQAISKQMSNLVLANQKSLEEGEKILELGSGSGNVTKYLVNKFGETNIIALEYDAILCQVLRKKFPKLKVIQGDACDFISLLTKNNIDKVKIKGIVSTLPLSNFSQDQLKKLNNKFSEIIRSNKIKLVEYRFLPFLKETHVIEGVKENTIMADKNQFFVCSLIIPTKIFIFEKN